MPSWVTIVAEPDTIVEHDIVAEPAIVRHDIVAKPDTIVRRDTRTKKRPGR